METEKRRRYYEYDDNFDLPIKKKSSRTTSVLILIGAGIGVVLLTCLIGVVIVAAFAMSSGTHPDEFVGAWKGRWTIGANTFDSVYTFGPDGTFREASSDLQGRLINISDGQWRFRNGQIQINWFNKSFEHAVVTHVDAKTISYHVVDHTEKEQIDMVVTMRRL